MSKELKDVVKAIDDKLGSDIVVLDFRKTNPYTDYFVICSALNNRMAKSIADNVEDMADKKGYPVRVVEGDEDSAWLLIDMYEIVVHIFVGGERDVYQLEKLWGDLPRVDVKL